MSRSIHQNKSTRYWQERGWKEPLLEDAVSLKRQSKRRVRVERRAGKQSVPARDRVPNLRVEIAEAGRFLFYPLLPIDLEEFLYTQCSGELEGLSALQLKADHSDLAALTREYGEAWAADAVLDPYLGRPSFEIFPGVYGPPVLGEYRLDSNTITMHAYICEPEIELIDPQWYYLEHRFLATLVHELAHHHDCHARQSRGRWFLGRDIDKDEEYAETQEELMVRDRVRPFLQYLHENGYKGTPW